MSALCTKANNGVIYMTLKLNGTVLYDKVQATAVGSTKLVSHTDPEYPTRTQFEVFRAQSGSSYYSWVEVTYYTPLHNVTINPSDVLQVEIYEDEGIGTIYHKLDGRYVPIDGTTITLNSNNELQVSGKQDTLVSGTNIKTINNQSLLGSGNITISGGGGSGIEVLDLSSYAWGDTLSAADLQSALSATLVKLPGYGQYDGPTVWQVTQVDTTAGSEFVELQSLVSSYNVTDATLFNMSIKNAYISAGELTKGDQTDAILPGNIPLNGDGNYVWQVAVDSANFAYTGSWAQSETWTFTLQDDTTVTKKIFTGN